MNKSEYALKLCKIMDEIIAKQAGRTPLLKPRTTASRQITHPAGLGEKRNLSDQILEGVVIGTFLGGMLLFIYLLIVLSGSWGGGVKVIFP